MENFKEKLRSFLDTELNNLINERCKETNTVLDHRTELIKRLTHDIVRNTYYFCDGKITPALLQKIIGEKFEDEKTRADMLKKITFAGASLYYSCKY